MNEQQRQVINRAALIKLATFRSAINHVLRQRALYKQAMGPIGGMVSQPDVRRVNPNAKTPNQGYNVKFQGPRGLVQPVRRKQTPPRKTFAFTGPTTTTGIGAGTYSNEPTSLGSNLNSSGWKSLDQRTPQKDSMNPPAVYER